MTATETNSPTIEVFFAGREFRVESDELALGSEPGDREVNRAVASYLGVEASRLRDHVVYRHSNGDVTLRPRSVFDR